MIIELQDTDAAEISHASLRVGRRLGPLTGTVFTLIVVTGADEMPEAREAAIAAGREHPARIIVVRHGDESGPDRVDARVRSGEDVGGVVIDLLLGGALIAGADSVVLPLLAPDSPTVVWWPCCAPARLSEDPIGRLATRRITDAAMDVDPVRALIERGRRHTPGDTDLAWTRLTPWRALLVAALDHHPSPISGGEVRAEAGDPSAALLAAWLGDRLDAPIALVPADGSGLSAVRLDAEDGPQEIVRADDTSAVFSVPGEPQRKVALIRASATRLITEELNRMDPDFAFEAAVRALGGAA